MPSITEGFGLPILEVQAAGVPMLSSGKGALPEIAGEGAFFVNPFLVSSIKEGMEEILADKNLRERLVRKGLENVSKFSWERTTYNTVDLPTKTVAHSKFSPKFRIV